MTQKKILIFSISAGIICAILLWFYLTSIEEKYKISGKQESVLVSKGYISAGTVIKESMFQIVKIPRQYIQPGAISSFEELIDEKGHYNFVTLLPVLEGEQLTRVKLSDVRKTIGLSLIIPEGMTAVPIPANPFTTLGGHIQPGNHVNVLCTYNPDQKGKPENQTITLFSDVLVLSVGPAIIGRAQKQEASKENLEENASVITLALSPKDAEILTYARERGSLTLILR